MHVLEKIVLPHAPQSILHRILPLKATPWTVLTQGVQSSRYRADGLVLSHWVRGSLPARPGRIFENGLLANTHGQVMTEPLLWPSATICSGLAQPSTWEWTAGISSYENGAIETRQVAVLLPSSSNVWT